MVGGEYIDELFVESVEGERRKSGTTCFTSTDKLSAKVDDINVK